MAFASPFGSAFAGLTGIRLDYLYNDDFTIPDTAPTDSPHAADRIGSVTNTDPSAINSIDASGLLWPTLRNGTFWRSQATVARATGLISYHKWTLIRNGSGTDSQPVIMGFMDATHATGAGMAGIRISAAANACQPKFYSAGAVLGTSDQPIEIALTDGIAYEMISVLLNPGAAAWIRGGSQFPQWTNLGIEHTTNAASVHYDFAFTGGFDATVYGLRWRTARVANPYQPFWTSDHVTSTMLSDANGYSSSFASAEDAFLFKIGSLPATGAQHRFLFRYTDANNHAFIDVLPSGANNVQFKEVRTGTPTAVLAQTTAVAGDVIGISRNNPASVTRRNRFWKNGALVSSINAAATSPIGTGFQVTTTNGGGSFTWVKSEPRTVVNPAFLELLSALAAGH